MGSEREQCSECLHLSGAVNTPDVGLCFEHAEVLAEQATAVEHQLAEARALLILLVTACPACPERACSNALHLAARRFVAATKPTGADAWRHGEPTDGE